MTDSRRRGGRVKALFGAASPDGELLEQGGTAMPDPEAQRQALQVLTMAQRTADEHVAAAQRQGDKIRTDARAGAEQVAREAQAHADGVRREADRVLTDARAAAEHIEREAQAHADGVRRDAATVMSDARAQAAEAVKQAQASADELEREAQHRYQEAVGGLAAKRTALQQQIEALQQFDRDYRARLRTFMQSQLHALDADEPPTTAEIHQVGYAEPNLPAPNHEDTSAYPTATPSG